MFKKILIPLDGSENAERSIPWAEYYAVAKHAQIVLLRVVPSIHPENAGYAETLSEARTYLRNMSREVNFAGVAVKAEVRRGEAPLTIAETSRKLGCDLILMTTRGASKVSRWRIGGVTQQVLRLSDIPVLVVRHPMQRSKQGRVRKILVPLDGSKLADSVINRSVTLARLHRASLQFYHVYPSGVGGPQTAFEERYEMLKRRTRRLCLRLRSEGIRVNFRVDEGDPATKILSQSADFDLIAMTTHGYGGFKRWVFGSVAEKVIHDSNVPIFVFKTPALPARKASEPLRAEVAL